MPESEYYHPVNHYKKLNTVFLKWLGILKQFFLFYVIMKLGAVFASIDTVCGMGISVVIWIFPMQKSEYIIQPLPGLIHITA